MKLRHLASLGVVVTVIVGSVEAMAAAQAPASSLRTPDGRPDLQGIWTFRTITPLERPRELAGKAILTRKRRPQREIGRQEQRGRPQANNPEDRGVGDRCLRGFNSGPPMLADSTGRCNGFR